MLFWIGYMLKYFPDCFETVLTVSQKIQMQKYEKLSLLNDGIVKMNLKFFTSNRTLALTVAERSFRMQKGVSSLALGMTNRYNLLRGRGGGSPVRTASSSLTLLKPSCHSEWNAVE